MRFTFSLFFIFLLPKLLFAQVTVVCDNPKYGGQKLEFQSYTDPISKATTPVFTLDIDKNGKASKTFETQITRFVFCDFGIYRGLLFIEPNQKIVLQLPPIREKSFADQKNPYFEPVSFWVATDDKKQLNNQISKLTAQLNVLSDKYFDQLYFRQLKPFLDTVNIQIEKTFPEIQSESFQFYKKFSLKLIEVDAFRMKPEEYSQIFMGVKPQFWLYPAFTELFDKTFSGLLSFDAKSVKGTEIRKAVNQGNTAILIDNLKTKYKITGDIADLALLKMLHDAFYSGDFSKTSIQQMIKSARFSGSANPIIKEASKQISEKITFLQTGSAAPTFCLKNIEGQNTCTNLNSGKYKYIIFADSEMAVCREQLKYLPAIQQKFTKNLEIFIVLRKTDATQTKKFFAENEVPGVKLIDETSEFIELYKVKSFPQCYLLDENHKVKLAVAKAPLDGFEQQFTSLLQQDYLDRQRKQGK